MDSVFYTLKSTYFALEEAEDTAETLPLDEVVRRGKE